MHKITFGRSAAVAVILAGVSSASAFATPVANISFHGGSVAFIDSRARNRSSGIWR